MKIATVDFSDDKFVVSCPFYDNERAKMIPDRKWHKTSKSWHVSLSRSNIRYLCENYTDEEFTALALRKIGEFQDKARKVKNEYFPGWYRFKNEPMKHQMEALNRAWGKSNFALFHEMGCGKTFTSINLSTAYAMEGKINSLLVICKTSVKHVWPTEIQTHSPIADNTLIYVLQSGAKGFEDFMADNTGKFKVMVVGTEALSRGSAFGLAKKFVSAGPCGCILDESSKIKNWKSKRTKAAIELGEYAKFRLILTGTSVTQGLQDLYAQFRFLNWDIIGHKSFYSFQARYCTMGGFENRQIVGYRNVAELLGLVSPYSHTVLKKDSLDLPPKVFETVLVEPTKDQITAMRSLKEEMLAENDGQILQVKTALDRLTRFSQICGGMFPYELVSDDGEKIYKTRPFDENPKMAELIDIIEDIPKDASVIIWARFVPEIEMIYDYLNEKFPGEVATYYGKTSEEERREYCAGFQTGTYRFFVSNQVTGGMGLTLTRASYVIYYSNSYSYEDRVQSEDRAHRKGQTNRVTYIDIILNTKVEKAVLAALKNKKDVASMVNDELTSGTFDNMFEV